MSRLPCNNRGFTLIEVLIALFLTIVAVLGTLALISPGWKMAAQSDYLGRASGILYERLVMEEARIMNPCNAVTSGGPTHITVFASGEDTAQSGDMPFKVSTTITSPAANVWQVRVQVSWPPLNPTGSITESQIVTRQEGFRTPGGCLD
jgi:Tfp pilus assembly protein PilV